MQLLNNLSSVSDNHPNYHIPAIIGITGGIGSGKSVVSRILRLNGFQVYDCDSEARAIMEADSEVRREICSVLGDEAYLEDGSVNKPHVSRHIFSDESKRKEINRIVHNAVRNHFLSKVAQCGVKLIFCESAILSTSHLDEICNMIWLIEASEDVRISRVSARDNLSTDDIILRIKSQQKEFDHLPEDKTLRIKNDPSSPLLLTILELTATYTHSPSPALSYSTQINISDL